MPITNITQFTGTFPDLSDPVTFDARMTAWQSWFDGFDGELFTVVDEMNLALNDNGTVLDASAEATRRSTNSAVTVLTAGTGAAYTLAAAVTVTALVANEPVAIIAHAPNAAGATIDVDGLRAVEIRKLNSTGTKVPLTGGEFSAYDAHILVYDGTYWILQTQPLRELIAGPALSVLPAQDGDFDLLVEGSFATKVEGDWTNGPLGASLQNYDAVNAVASIVDRGTDFVIQTVSMLIAGALQEYRRTGEGAPLVWGDWASVRGVWEPYNAGSGGDGKFYDFAVNGASDAIIVPDFVDGYDYRVRFQELDSVGSTWWNMELFLETDAIYHPDALRLGVSTTRPYFGSVRFEGLRQVVPWKVIHATLVATPSIIAGTNDSYLYARDGSFGYSNEVQLATAQKITRARISTNDGSGSSAGQLYLERKQG